MNDGHSQAPRIRHRMRVSHTDCSCRSTLTRYPWPRPPETPRGRQVRKRRPEDPGGAKRKGNTPHGDRSSTVRGLAGGPAGRIGAPDHRGPGRAPARDADDARHRGARDDALPAGQGARLVLRRLRPGGRVRRAGVGDGRAGPALHPAPRPRRARDPRRGDGAHLRPVHGPRRRHHRRPRRQRALRRPHQGLRRHGLDAPRHDADRDRARDGVQAARRAARRHDVVRRRLDLARRLPRGDELGRRPAPAGHLHPREQPVRVLDAARPAVRGQPRRARRRLRLPGRQGRRQRRRGDVRGRPRRPRARARRRGPDDDRGADHAHARPRRARRHEVRAEGEGRGVAGEGPDRPPGAPRRGARRRRRRPARRGHGGDRRGRRARAREPDARRRDGHRPPVRRRAGAARGRQRAVERLRRRRRA